MHATDICGLSLRRNLKDVPKFSSLHGIASVSLASLKHLNFLTIKSKCSQTGRTTDLLPRAVNTIRVSLSAQSTIIRP